MSQTPRKYTTTISVTNGVGTKSITGDEFRAMTDASGYIEQILIKAPRVTDTFLLDLIDNDGFSIWDGEGSKGKINDTTRIPIPMPTHAETSSYTLSVTEARTKDDAEITGTFDVKLILREAW